MGNEQDLYRLLIGAKMIGESFPTRTIEFFMCIFPHLSDGLSQKEMSDIYGCTPQAAKKHVDVLTARKYLRREHYRLWSLERTAVDTLEIRQIMQKV